MTYHPFNPLYISPHTYTLMSTSLYLYPLQLSNSEGEVTKGGVTKGEVTKGGVTKGEVTKGEVRSAG